jgi:hypothetical protein
VAVSLRWLLFVGPRAIDNIHVGPQVGWTVVEVYVKGVQICGTNLHHRL